MTFLIVISALALALIWCNRQGMRDMWRYRHHPKRALDGNDWQELLVVALFVGAIVGTLISRG